MPASSTRLPAWATLALAFGCAGPATETDPATQTVRFATFNVSMFRNTSGRLARDLADPEHEQARLAAAILQTVRPDVVLLNEVDWDDRGEAVELLRANFLEVGQDGLAPLSFPHTWIPTVNTGVPSGVDLNRDGEVGGRPGTEVYGNDALGFGVFPGQYGMVVLSRFPIDTASIRTFQRLLWRDVPDNRIPNGYYSDEALAVLPLSSKTHADVPVQVGARVVHLLVSHPTPPSFDGAEDKNGRRNHDEIALWRAYLDGASWLTDDAGVAGGLPSGASVVLAGDLNADPNDGDSTDNPIGALLAHPRLAGLTPPASEGAREQSEKQGGKNQTHRGPPEADTTDFNDETVGNLRIDYVLPSSDLPVLSSGVYWPRSDQPGFALVGTYPFPVSDHRLVWVDVAVADR